MNKIKLAAVVAVLSASATSALADTTQGSYVGIGLGEYNGNMNVNGMGINGNMGSQNLDTSVGVFGGYNWNFGKESIAAELSYNSNIGQVDTGTYSAKLKNNWQLSLLPGYNFTKDTEGYVRVGFAQADGVPSIGQSHTFNGTVLGLGVDEAVTRNIALRLEWQYMKFNSYSANNGSITPDTTGVNLSARYAF